MIAAGIKVSWALTEDGRVFAWGKNVGGAPGRHSFVPMFLFARPKTSEDPYTELFGSYSTAFLRTTCNQLYSWGENNLGECGIDSRSHIIYQPRLVNFDYKDESIKSVVMYQEKPKDHIYAILSENNQVYAWGNGRRSPELVDLRTRKKVASLLSVGSDIVIFFEDMTATLFSQLRPYEEPRYFPIEDLAQQLSQYCECSKSYKLVIKTNDDEDRLALRSTTNCPRQERFR